MVIYADTSALVPLYVDEEQSQTIDRYVASLDEGLVFTPFHRLELRTALRLRVFRKESTNEELKGALRQVDEHVRVDLLRHVPLDWNDALRKAETIAAAHLIQVGARSGDLLPSPARWCWTRLNSARSTSTKRFSPSVRG
jgi:predicted nucleic acid-binding protein